VNWLLKMLISGVRWKIRFDGAIRVSVQSWSGNEMEDSSVENRLENLEQKVLGILEVIKESGSNGGTVKDWRQSLGMFNDHPVMKQIDEEGQRIRQQNRDQVANDHS